jgi:uncharacterized protein (DUF433 family)
MNPNSRDSDSNSGFDAGVADSPAYTIVEAAGYLRMPPATLRTWVRGRPYDTQVGRVRWSPVIETPREGPAEGRSSLLSFNNLVEAHVLSAIRRKHEIAFPKVRQAVDYVREQLGVERPLLDQQFETDGVEIFVREFGQLVAVSRGGQMALSDILRDHLSRIDRRPGMLRLFPFTRARGSEPVLDSPRVIVIDPRVSFGRPVLAETGVRAEVIVGRFVAGETRDQLAADLGLDPRLVEEALRWEQLVA